MVKLLLALAAALPLATVTATAAPVTARVGVIPVIGAAPILHGASPG